MSIIINPGTGPVEGHSIDHSRRNIAAFCDDLGDGWTVLDYAIRDDGTGRYPYVITHDETGRCVDVDMPGLPLDQVRYVAGEGQNIWDYPRLYVNGSSWVWAYATGAALDEGDE